MVDFRYAQHCPLARAAEIVGERWTILVVRELLLGPKRFSDLKRGLAGVSSSILSQRLARLEERGIVERGEIAPPTPATLYALTPLGRELEPVVLALVRWGANLLGAPRPGDHFEPEWLRLGVATLLRSGPTPPGTIGVAVAGAEHAGFTLVGGSVGADVRGGTAGADVSITLPADAPMTLFALASGALAPADAVERGMISAAGDLAVLDVLPEFFESTPGDDPHPPQGA